MVLTYAKDITRAYGGNVVRDCVITVPAYATQLEREALLAAAELADLRVCCGVPPRRASGERRRPRLASRGDSVLARISFDRQGQY